MQTEECFLRHIVEHPEEAEATWLVLADWLEERDDPRSELVRLLHDPRYRSRLTPAECDERVRELLASGIPPIMPRLVNSIGIEFVLIPRGVFLMGSPEVSQYADEGPQHEVEITRPFFLSVHEVTQEQYQRVMGSNPSYFSDSGYGKDRVQGLDTRRFPVETVSWENAVAYCQTLSGLPQEKQAGRRYRLPTEAEWEYA